MPACPNSCPSVLTPEAYDNMLTVIIMFTISVYSKMLNFINLHCVQYTAFDNVLALSQTLQIQLLDLKIKSAAEYNTAELFYKVLYTIITRRMAIANGTCVIFCNQPKAQFGYLSSHVGMSLPSPVLWVEAFGYIKRV